ncbi:MAG: ribosomal-processing cysteine protease Prp [Acholeplasmataceae bacterium]|jgi:uncharacterized protein YsxB (DUF464 family)|nr:ribosomal-processing cysteine protease Prp [Acholeplasmataceae bacterium]
MIKVNVVSTDVIEKITVSGHSGYAEAGADIVCSAVSTAMYLSLGLIEKVCPKYDFKSDEKNALMELTIIETNEFTEMVLENLVASLEGISSDYADYLQVKIKKRR